jgi:hypothetical protein
MSSVSPNKPTGPQLSGVVGFFDTPDTLIVATTKVRDSNYKHFDCFTPFPVHGLEHAQGLKRSPIPFVTTICAFSGTATAFWWQYHASGDWWPHIIGGKPFNSLPAFVPIMFELSILFGGLATFYAMLFFNRLPNLSKRAFDPAITNNRFAIVIENPPLDWNDEDAVKAHHFSPEEVESYLKSIGAKDVRKVYEEGWF